MGYPLRCALVLAGAGFVALTAGMALMTGQQRLLDLIPIDNDFMYNFAVRSSSHWDAWQLWKDHFAAPRAVSLLFEAGNVLQPEALEAARAAERAVLELSVAF